jgi:hypothetical protein
MFRLLVTFAGVVALCAPSFAQTPEPIDVEGQPLASNVERVLRGLDLLGTPLADNETKAILQAVRERKAETLQKLLDPHVLFLVNLNPEARVKAKRGPATVALQQGGYVPVLVKVHNESGFVGKLGVRSPQALPIVSRGRPGEITEQDVKNRFLDLEIFGKEPLTEKLSGLKVEYAVLLIHSSQAGKREAVFAFDAGQGTQDLGFRAEVPVLFDVKPAIPVKVTVLDTDGTPTTGRFTFLDKQGHVYPPQAKRLAPDFFFQQQVYRHSGGTVLLPPGPLTMIYGRGPEYRLRKREIVVSEKDKAIDVKLERWISPTKYGWYGGDHHIHAAGCQHYTNPTEGVFAEDMFLHVKGEGLNVGCNLTWGPCFEFQRQFFEPHAHKISEPMTVLKYDIEVSGFGSQLLGHVCLLNLRDQEYPGSAGTKTKGWPTWTTPLMKWAKDQGAYTGYAHSANGLAINPKAAAERLMKRLDKNGDGALTENEVKGELLPEPFAKIDRDGDGQVTLAELVASHQRAAEVLPNLAVPEMNGIGAQEICVTTAQGLCDFISAMDTARIPEWNCWYHLMNCGFPLKASGETDFPCITGARVGQGRVYVQLGKVDRIDFPAWAKGLAEGRSYVSDGYAHALEFTVDGQPAGAIVRLEKAGTVKVKARVAFASEPLLGTAVGANLPPGTKRSVEVIVNGVAVAKREVPADDREHELTFDVPTPRSSWVALRSYPQMHTNPVDVLVENRPIRASRRSAQWCVEVIEQLWRVRENAIAESERELARKTFRAAVERYRTIAAECAEGS